MQNQIHQLKIYPMKRLLICLIFCAIGMSAFAQAYDYNWTATNSPYTQFRFDDAFFLNADTGWAVNYAYSNDDGFVMRTYDGGTTWQKVWDSTAIAYRDIAFTDANHGWIGTFEEISASGDTAMMYQTTDGGTTWNTVNNLPGPRPAGICGMHALNDSTVFAVGRYPGPSGFYKTVDNGQNWDYVNLDSLAGGLVDVHFFSPDTGFAVGSDGDWFNGKGIILQTNNGGQNWSVAHVSAHPQEICWKISFPSRQIGYVSLQAFANSGWQYMLKTTDGGITWDDVNVSTGGGPTGGYNIQGIGFINDSTGWIGGSNTTFFTNDGGDTWTREFWGSTINRFRILNDSVAYAAGLEMYRLNRTIVGIEDEQRQNFTLHQNAPNPFQDKTIIEYFIPAPHKVELTIFDSMGKLVSKLIDSEVEAGNHRLIWSVEDIPNGIYYYTLKLGDQQATRRLIIQR